MRRVFVSCALALTLVGCGTAYGADSAITGTTAQRSPSRMHVSIIMADEPMPEGAFEELGLVRAAGYGASVSDTEVMSRLRGQASALGADTILFVRREQSEFDLVLVGLAVRRR